MWHSDGRKAGRAITGAVSQLAFVEAQHHDGRTSDVRLGLAWLVRVRYGAVGLFALALIVGRFALGLEVQYGFTVALLGLTLATNLVLSSYQARARRIVLPFVLAFDVATLAALLLLSGGAANPFSVFFLVHVALAAVLLTPALAWGFVLLTVLSFGSLFLVPMPGHHHHHGGAAFSTHLLGMWLAYALSAGFVAYFVGRVSRAVRKLDREAAELRILALQNERLATLTSFSATAAHELASPLSTIALSAEELEGAASRLPPDAGLAADVSLIRREIRRCRDILHELSSRAGESMGEMPEKATLGEIVDRLLAQLSPRLAARLRVQFAEGAPREHSIVTTKQTLVYLLHGLIRNAFEAGEDSQSATVDLVVARAELLRFRVLDRGSGVRSDVLERIGEPFVTTKSDRGGLGLGLFLARAFAERAGGAFVLRARDGGGTEAELSLSERAFMAWEGP